MKNLCGKCNVCCEVLRIDKSEIFWKEDDKKANIMCEKLVNGQCSIYKDRPNSCKIFECLWLQLSKKINNFSEDFRPDNLDILVRTNYYPDTNEFIFEVRELKDNILDFNNLNNKIDYFFRIIFNVAKKQKGIPKVIIFKFNEEKGHELKIEGAI
jgi:hypothetical protein